MSYTPWFPEPGSYLKKFDVTSKEYKFLRLLWSRDPFTYPFRFPSLAADTKSSSQDFEDLNPSEAKNHIYLAYLGVKQGFRYFLYHPIDIPHAKWDETPKAIDDDISKSFTSEQSPFDFPTKSIAIEHDRYPGLTALNISGVTNYPEVIWIASLYVVQPHEKLTKEEIDKLRNNQIRSYPWDFGGEI